MSPDPTPAVARLEVDGVRSEVRGVENVNSIKRAVANQLPKATDPMANWLEETFTTAATYGRGVSFQYPGSSSVEKEPAQREMVGEQYAP